MNNITHSQRYLPRELNTKYDAVKLYRTGVGVSFVCRRYKISKSSLLLWNKKFDDTKDSLVDKSHRPLTKHPNAHTIDKGYSRHPGSLYCVFRRLGYSSAAPSTKKKGENRPYDIPLNLVSNGRWM